MSDLADEIYEATGIIFGAPQLAAMTQFIEARVAAARDEGGREALTGALHPEFGSIYAPNGAATVAREAGRREGIEAALTAALRMWPEADDLHDAIRTLLEEGGR